MTKKALGMGLVLGLGLGLGLHLLGPDQDSSLEEMGHGPTS